MRYLGMMFSLVVFIKLKSMEDVHAFKDKKASRPRSASTDYAIKDPKKSPDRFTDPGLRQEAKNYHDATDVKKSLAWALKQPAERLKDKYGKFKNVLINFELLAKLSAKIMTEAESNNDHRELEETLLYFKERVHAVSADYHYHLALAHERKALKYFQEHQQQTRTEGSPHSLLQKAIGNCKEAQTNLRTSWQLNPNEEISNKLQEINSLCLQWSKELQANPLYRASINEAKKAFVKQRSGELSLRQSQQTLEKSKAKHDNYKALLLEAKKYAIGAVEDYLRSAEKYLDKTTLKAAERNLENVHQIEKQLHDLNPNAYRIEPKIGELAEKISKGFRKLKELEDNQSGISSVENSIEFSPRS